MAAFALLIGGASWLASWEQDRLEKKVQQWPTTQAIVEGGRFDRIPGGGKHDSQPFKAPVLVFSYHAGGEYHSGCVALMEFFDDDGAEIIRRMSGQTLEIYYDPQDSTKWYYDDDRIAGCRIKQEGLQSEGSRSF